VRTGGLSRDERTSGGLTAQPRPAAQVKTRLQRPVLLSVFHGRPDEQADHEDGGQKDKDAENDSGCEVHVVILHSVQPDRAAVAKISAIVRASAGSRGSLSLTGRCHDGRKGRPRATRANACGFPSSSSFDPLRGTATITGVGFFDFIHGQTGVAPNGIELHPVLSFTKARCS
jgi:hypothetical protein